MITREEALSDKPFIQAECEKCDYVDLYYNDSAYKRMINQIYDGFEQHIKSLEAQLANTEQLTCKDCSKKLLCEMAQKSKDTFGTKLYEQWFNCFEKDTQ